MKITLLRLILKITSGNIHRRSERDTWCNITFWPYSKSFIDQACSVKMAGSWPRLVFGPFLVLRMMRSPNVIMM